MRAVLGLSLGLLVGPVAPAVASDPPPAGAWYVDRAVEAGLDRAHRHRSFENPYAKIMEGYTALGAAVAVADYDRDGDDDLFLTDSSATGRNLLYRNEGDGTFTEVGEEAGVAHGNDARNASADALWFAADGDAWPDLLVVRFGRSLLYRNLGDGTFEDVTEAAGLRGYLNAIAAITFDHDGDGDLDLLLGNYFSAVDLFEPETPRFFPESFETAANGGGLTLWRNDGDGETIRFADATEEAGLAGHTGWTLDLGHADVDDDGDQDLYVAADFGTDRLFLNDGDGTFTDVTEATLGIDTKKGMNADWGDFDNDGRLDCFVTNITDEYMREGNFLWQNLGEGTFVEVARETGVHDTGWGWAGKFFDADNDGWLDLYTVNGWVSGSEENYVLDVFELITTPDVDLADARNWPPMGEKTLSGYQRNHLFLNRGGTLFEDEAARHGVDSIRDARGVAILDLFDDGRLDLVVTNAGAVPHLFVHVGESANHWIGLVLEGSGRNPEAIGALVRATAGGAERIRLVDGGNGFAGQSSRRVHFGLGAADSVETLEIRWPSGVTSTFTDVAADRIWRAVEGEPALRPFREHVAGSGGRIPSSPDVLLEQGLAAAAAGETQRALDLLEAATSAAPDELRFGAEYRQVAIAAEAYDRSLAFFEGLAAEHPQSNAVQLNWGYAYVDKIPAAGAITGVILANTALGRFTAALELEETWLGYYTRGNSYVYWPAIFGRTELAIADLEKAVALGEETTPRAYHAFAYAALGDAHWRLEDLETARAIWRSGLERIPDAPPLEERLALDDEALQTRLEALYAIDNRVGTHLRELATPDGDAR